MTRFVWVRHGPTHAKAFTGWRDIPADLSDTPALMRLSNSLPETAIVVSSDLKRASATASQIQGARERLPDRANLREFNFGDWDGLPFDKVAQMSPKTSRAFWEQPGDVAPPNGESWNALSDRIEADVQRLLAKHPSRDFVIVAHFGVILTQLARARAVTAFEILAQEIAPLSQTIIDITGDTRQALSANIVI